MNKNILITLLLVTSFILGGCGFKPLYKISDDYSGIRNYNVEVINSIPREIIEEINANNFSKDNTAYKVLIRIDDDRIPLIINTNGTVSKYRIEVSISFEIVQTATGDIIATGITRGFAQYDVGSSEINNEDTRKNMTKTATKNALQIMISKVESGIARSNDN